MGTRNLTAVMLNGEYKIAQYGQWDGYPEGQGKTILEFLTGDGNIDKLKSALRRVRFLDGEGRDKEFLAEYDKNCPEWSSDPDNRTPEQKRWFQTYVSRDLGGKILEAVASSEDAEILLRNSIDFAGDSLSCEYAYVVDLDKGTFEVYEGFNKAPLPAGERFAESPINVRAKFDDCCYYAVKHRKTFQISALPSADDFIAAFKDEDDCEDV